MTTPTTMDEITPWKYMHPMLSAYVYKELPEPKSLEDAHCRMVMHKNAVEDIEIQIKISQMNHSIFLDSLSTEDSEPIDPAKFEAKHKKHMEKNVVLLNSQLQHKRKAAAYWYWMQCHQDNIPQSEEVS
jgi:hypothetical protein